MNANKQDAGGLPELPEPGHYDDYEGEWYWTGSQMRAYGELCRAAPAGGDVPCDMGEMCLGCTPRNADGSCPDAAPAGSGEVVTEWVAMPMVYDNGPAGDDDWIIAEKDGVGIAWHLDKADALHIIDLHNAALLRKLQQGAECFVREMRTSKGSEFFVVVRCNGRELTPHMYTERWKAEYDVASWQHLLCGAPEPDLLAYGPDAASQDQEGGHARD